MSRAREESPQIPNSGVCLACQGPIKPRKKFIICGKELKPFQQTLCQECIEERIEKRIRKEERQESGAKEWERQRKCALLLKNSGIDLRSKDYTFASYSLYESHFNQHKAHKYCKLFSDNFSEHLDLGTWFLLLGLPGTGKTHLSVSILKAVIQQGFSALTINALEMLCEIKDTWKTKQSTKEVINRFTSVDLLVIEDIQLCKSEILQDGLLSIDQRFYQQILDKRYGCKKPTIFISNLDFPSVSCALGIAVADRLTQKGNKCFVFDWESHRRKGEQK